MIVAQASICNKKGLHARAAAKVVKAATMFAASIELVRLPREGDIALDMPRAGATSILSLLMLGADCGSRVELRATGAEAPQAVEAILDLINRRFDEEA